ncbi:helix-turn-helix domain-containing protein [Bordetella avium]|uniref:helix-turn-helix domain-containing protein n=1 Tax=Bordetella avium TaxID=521 RepID=UPI0009DFD54D|nr:helix-turn-helix transcriptional regulator [Bordetella avium]AZY47923.1 XRE family transcriptional regulator [Bordetella avium]AZY51294.1 XRE family transcriptional regulator [Bordetella avium]RIQ14850.1 XRE family transcriptional regulator [Bordetella avium]RIQ18658.1 XRE family transcriptional regulator [Bordetella avium]RIQ35306.1 XRE family transcriptional regulator [Bordetella avium]
MKTFSDRLRQARVLRGYTQQDLARICGLSQSAIGSYETGQRLSSRSIRRLALALNVSLDWLEMGQGPMGPAASLMEPPPTREGCETPWPFRSVAPEHVEALSQRDLLLLENTIRSFIEACQAEPAGPQNRRTRRPR